ncbi:MAG: HIRAN domain-containing protein [Lachnospiraceae bacterium]|nr:HIRAN domain-containing protein [Lachnospiraceae bacterium]
MENVLTVVDKKMVSLIKENELEDLIKPLQHEILLFDSFVAGTANIKDETVFRELKKGDTLRLIREPDNKFDENAILVIDTKNRKLGYIPEKDNIVFARLMDAGKYLTAKTESVDLHSSFRKINIGIYLVDY